MPLQSPSVLDLAAPPSAGALSSIGVRMHFAAGEEIYAQEDVADLIYELIGGAARTSRLVSDGRRQIGDFYYPGEVLGIEAGMLHGFSAEALEDCTILAAKRSAIRHCGEDRQRLEALVWGATARELERTQAHLFLLGRKTACERVASFLMAVADRMQGEVATLAMSRQDMADYLGLTIETVSRMLTQLQAWDVVRFESARSFRVPCRPALARLIVA